MKLQLVKFRGSIYNLNLGNNMHPVDKLGEDQNCTFCKEFMDIENSEFRSFFSYSELPSRIVANTENFICLAALGAVREGYLLILPKKHIPSFAFLDFTLANEAQNFLNDIVRMAKKNFSNSLIVFEHGTMDNENSENRGSGGCIDHAHIHIFPTSIDPFKEIVSEFSYQKVNHIKNLSTFKEQNSPYLYYGKDDFRVAFIVDKPVPSQYIRRLLWKKELNPDEWDWSLFVGKNHVIETVKRFKNVNK